MPGKIGAQLEFLESHEDCIAVYSNGVVITDNGNVWGVFNNMQPTTFDIRYLVGQGNFLLHSSLFYRRRARDSLLKLPLNFTDYRIHLELASHGTLGYVNAAHTVYRLGSTTSIIKHKFAIYQEQYWESIVAAATMVPKADACRGIAYFLAPILGNSLRPCLSGCNLLCMI